MPKLVKRNKDNKGGLPMQIREPDVEAVFENCRESKNYINNGFCVPHLVKENLQTTGMQRYYDIEKLEYGKTTLGTITFIAPEHHMHCLWVGKKIPFCEGVKIIGYATIQKIFNKQLEKKETYFIEKKDLPGSCYYEFQPGKYKGGLFRNGEVKLDSSLYLYGDDDGQFDYSVIAPIGCLISGTHPDSKAPKNFDPFGITYIDENDGKAMIKNLREFADLLGKGEAVTNTLIKMGLFSFEDEEKWTNDAMKKHNIGRERIEAFDDNGRVSRLNPIVLKNTAEALAYWTETQLITHGMISILGI